MRLLLKLKLLMRKPQERQELEVTENNNNSKQTNKKKDLTKKLTN